MAKKPITVTLKKGKWKGKQVFTFEIDQVGPGPIETVRERYTRKYDAARGALRILDAVTHPNGYSVRQFKRIAHLAWFSKDGRAIIFIHPKRTKR